MPNYNQFMPMGYNYNPYMPNIFPQYQYPQNYGQTQQNTSTTNQQNNQNFQSAYTPPMNTNIIYVNGIEDVKNRPLPFNSNYIFLDNDKPLAYRKVVDSMGKMTVEPYDIVLHKEETEKVANNTASVDTSAFVNRKEYEALRSELEQLKTLVRQTTQEQPKQVVRTLNSSPTEVSK